MLPDDRAAPIEGTLARVRREGDVTFRDNQFVAGATGISVAGAYEPALARVYDNVFRLCGTAVAIAATSSSAHLGNLGNASTTDDGGNTFRSTNTWHVYNLSANAIKAEGNDWNTTSKAAINAKIWDRRDEPKLGRVNFDPLEGGVSPTGDTVAALQLTGACAVPTRGGAEIAFTLSAPADVTVEVLNIAGRPIATVAHDVAAEAGTQRVVWSGCADTGLRAPSGRYLVRVTARNADGQEASGLAPVALR